MTHAVAPSTARPPSGGRGGALDGLRFVAALLIVVYHYGTNAPVNLQDLHPVFARGYLATDFFLILSGYVLGRAYGAQILSGRIGLVDFLKKRVARIWPGQLVVLAALAAVVGLAALVGVSPGHPDNFTLRGLAMQALLVQAWGLPGGGGGWNHQSWSLSALVVCYAIFPFAWRLISRLNSPAALLALGLTAMMAGDLVCRALFGHALYDLGFHLGVVRAAPFFLLGLCIARVVEQGEPPTRAAGPLAMLSLVVLVTLQVLGRFDLASLIAIAGVVLAFGRLPVARPSHLLEQGAKLSFALFITHALTGLVWFGALGVLRSHTDLAPWLDWTLWGASIPAALVVSALFHRWIDDPLQKWLAPRLATRKRTAAVAV